MVQAKPKKDWGIRLRAVNNKEDLKPNAGFDINPPPEGGRCDICGKHISELKPFGGPGDPLEGDVSGHYLAEKSRPATPYIEEIGRVWKEAEGACKDSTEENCIRYWFIAKYGKEEGERLYTVGFSMNFVRVLSWECRDCAVLSDEENFEMLRKRFGESQHQQIPRHEAPSSLECSGTSPQQNIQKVTRQLHLFKK